MALWQPNTADLPTLKMWLDADQETAGALTTFTDRSGQGNSPTQATPSRRPTVTAGVLNGRKGVLFARANSQCLVKTSPAGISDNQFTAISVWSHTAVAGQDQALIGLWRASASSTLVGYWMSTGGTANVDVVASLGSLSDRAAAAGSGAASVISGQHVPTGRKLWRNGPLAASNATAYAATTVTQIEIGSIDNASQMFLDGYIHEVVYCTGALADADRQRVEGYLAWKWGLQADLSASHPYKTAPPMADSVTVTDAVDVSLDPQTLAGYNYLTDRDGDYLLDRDGSYLLEPTAAGGATTSTSRADSVAPTDALTKSVTLVLADSATPGDSATKQVSAALADSAPATDALVRAASITLLDSVAATEAAAISDLEPPAGYIFLLDQDGYYLQGQDGSYLLELDGTADVTVPYLLSIEDAVSVTDVLADTSPAPTPPTNYVFLLDQDGYYLLDPDGYYLLEGSGDVDPGTLLDLADNVSLTDTLGFSASLALADATTPLDINSVANHVTMAGLNDSAAPADDAARAFARLLSDSVDTGPGETTSASVGAALADSVAPADEALTYAPGPLDDTFADSVAATDEMIRDLVIAKADAASVADSELRRWTSTATHFYMEPISAPRVATPRTIAEQVSAYQTLGRNMAQAIDTQVSMGDEVYVAKTATALADDATPGDAATSGVTKTVLDAVTAADTLNELNVYPPKPNDPATVSDVAARAFSKVLADSVAAADQATKTPQLAKTDSVSATDAVNAGAVTFVGALSHIPSTSTSIVPLPAGTMIGDYVVIFTELDTTSAGSNVIAGGTFTKVARAWWYNASLHHGVLSTNPASGITMSNLGGPTGMVMVGVWRGASTAGVLRDVGSSATNGPSLVLPGATPPVGFKAVISLLSDRDTDVTPVVPAGWTPRLQGAGGAFRGAIADMLTTPYGGTDVTWTGLQGPMFNYGQHGYLLYVA